MIWQYLKKRKKWIPILIAILSINACLNIGIIVAENLAHHQELDWIFYIINEFTGTFTILVFIPFLFLLFKKYPLRKPHLGSRVILYLLSSLLFGFLYTSIMYAARVPLYTLVGITRLDEIFNNLPYRYLMEYFKQFFTFWLVFVIYLAVDQYRSNRNRMLKEAQLKEELLRSQLKTLQMQLHPHFFFNTLNTISSVMYNDPKRADKIISLLSDFLRNVLGLKDQLQHTLQEEIQLLQKFTGIMMQRYPDKLMIDYQVDENCLREQIPVLLLQPIVENAIHYGIDHQEKTIVEIKSKLKDAHLNILITDNGPGVAEGNVNQGTGLSSTILRLQKLYKDQYQFELKNRVEGGLKVSIELPKSVVV